MAGTNSMLGQLTHSWTAYRRRILVTAIYLMVIAATVWLTYQFWRLLFQPTPPGAIDLAIRFEETWRWFDGQDVYGQFINAVYPPASYTLLWPFLGWMDMTTARWLWAITTIAALCWMAVVFVRESCARSRELKWLILLCPFAAYATGAAVGNGQLIVHQLLCLVLACLLVARSEGGWGEYLAASALFLFALVKPAVAAPFFWIFLFIKGGIRPAALIVTAYASLTLWAATFQEGSLLQLMVDWYRNSATVLSEIATRYSNGNAHSLLTWLGADAWITSVTLTMLAVLGLWVYRFRKTDVWILLGVCALVSRLYTYHGWYDDLLILLPMIAVFRVTQSDEHTAEMKAIAGVLFGASLLFMVAPGGLYLLPPPCNSIYVAIQVMIWLVMLGFLCKAAWEEERL